MPTKIRPHAPKWLFPGIIQYGNLIAVKWKEFISDYLTFSRKDRVGVLVIIGMTLIIFFLPKFFSGNAHSKSPKNDTSWVLAMKQLEQEQKKDYDEKNNDESGYAYQYDHSQNTYLEKKSGELFFFDPNKLSSSEWKRLGLRDKTIRTIENYLSKGGHFRKPEDLQKVYGLHKDEYERLAPYIKIELSVVSDISKNEKEIIDKNPTPRYSAIDVNAADTSAFISLPGIGSKLAARIVNFREKLGGFYSVLQIGETFGLPDSTFQKIKQYLKLENTSVKKININTATVDELKAHPYVKWSIANPIVSYRNEHGPFSSIEDIKKVMAVTDEIYNKIAPYLTK